MMSTDVPLPQAIAEIQQKSRTPISYNRVYRACLEGRISASFVGGRWFIPRAEIDLIAAKLAA